MYRTSKVYYFLTILVIICETFRELDGPKGTHELSSYAVRLLKENFEIY